MCWESCRPANEAERFRKVTTCELCFLRQLLSAKSASKREAEAREGESFIDQYMRDSGPCRTAVFFKALILSPVHLRWPTAQGRDTKPWRPELVEGRLGEVERGRQRTTSLPKPLSAATRRQAAKSRCLSPEGERDNLTRRHEGTKCLPNNVRAELVEALSCFGGCRKRQPFDKLWANGVCELNLSSCLRAFV